MTSVRDFLRGVQTEMRGDELLPTRASDLLRQLTAIQGDANRELRQRDMAYKRELLQAYKTHDTANRAKIAAETSVEYEALMEAKHVKEEIVESIRSLKACLRSLEEEMRLAR